jgi:hypothetical protein
MKKSNWRERREAYLREAGKFHKLIRESYDTGPRSQWRVIQGGRTHLGKQGSCPTMECTHGEIRHDLEVAVPAVSICTGA